MSRAVADRPHLSIGEVLSLLQEQFPDVTISKIRFLESQGLVDPERTPSGYRKFYEADIDRLRWILRQQRENFLPLKVIKDRLLEHDRTGVELDATGRAAPGEDGEAAGTLAFGSPASPAASPAASPPAPPSPPAAASPASPPEAVPPPPLPTPPANPASGVALLDSAPNTVSLNTAELAGAAGLRESDVADLERFGLIGGRIVGRDTVYDDDALVVAKLAAGFLRFGVEARHLRMYKVAAEREAGFFEQVVMPMVKQRNPAARQRAVDTLGELAGLGDGLRTAMLRHALRGYSADR